MCRQNKKGPDNLTTCANAAKELSEKTGKTVSYGQYMALIQQKKKLLEKQKKTENHRVKK